MHHIVYNPLSKSGKNEKSIVELETILSNQGFEHKRLNALEIGNPIDMLKSLDKNDKIVFVGGDGTMHFLANYLAGQKIEQELFAYAAGTGNDFFRNIGATDKITKINDWLTNLPRYTIGEVTGVYLNGCGMGLDARVCDLVNRSNGVDSSSYVKCALKAFATYMPTNQVITVDGVRYEFKNCWLTSVMHGKNQGGGMPFSPNANWDGETLDVVVAHDLSRLGLIILFPKIYKGKHIDNKKKVTVISGKHIVIESNRPVPLQADGEVTPEVSRVEIYR